MKVLIAGGGGNLGTKLANYLHESSDYHVVLVDLCFSEDALKKTSQRWQLVTGNLTLWNEEWVKAFEGVDIVFHFATVNSTPKASWHECSLSIDITANVCNAAVKHHVPRVVFASSNHVMGGYLKQGLKAGELTTQLPLIGSTNFETNEWQMEATAYASAKIFGERLLKSLVDSGNLKSAIAIRIGWAQMGENHPKTIDIHGSRKAIKGEITPLEEKKTVGFNTLMVSRDVVVQ